MMTFSGRYWYQLATLQVLRKDMSNGHIKGFLITPTYESFYKSQHGYYGFPLYDVFVEHLED